MTNRPVSISHLVFGLIFVGAAGMWLIGVLTDAGTPDFALWGPAVLIGAGVIGLIATFVNARRREPSSIDPEAAPAAWSDELGSADADVLDHEEQR